MAKNLLNNYVELNREDKESLLKLLREDLGCVSTKKYKKYDEITIGGDTYFVLDYNEDSKELTVCMKDLISVEDTKKYFTDKWYIDSYCDVRYNSDIRNNKYEDSYIYKVLNGVWKENKLKDINLVGDVRLLTKEEIEGLDDEYRKTDSSRYGFWTMTPYNDMNELENGAYAGVFSVYSNGYLNDSNNVGNTNGVRPVITLKTEELD